MKAIWKFELEIEDEQTIKMPVDAEILCVQPQSKRICLWAMVNPEEVKKEVHTFFIYGTGYPIERSSDKMYLGTVLLINGSIEFHVFEQIQE